MHPYAVARTSLFPRKRLDYGLHGIPGVNGTSRPTNDKELADLTSACHDLLLQYCLIAGRGVPLTALKVHKVAVASGLAHFRKVLADYPQSGQVEQQGDIGVVGVEIERILRIPQQEREGAVQQLAVQFEWLSVVLPVAAALRDWGSRRASRPGVSEVVPQTNRPLQ